MSGRVFSNRPARMPRGARTCWFERRRRFVGHRGGKQSLVDESRGAGRQRCKENHTTARSPRWREGYGSTPCTLPRRVCSLICPNKPPAGAVRGESHECPVQASWSSDLLEARDDG